MFYLLLVSCLLFRSYSSAYEHPRGTYCPVSASTYSPNSAFSTDLSRTLTTLRSYTANSGFYVSTFGTATSAALCRATIPISSCQYCINAAVMALVNACPTRTSAQVWYTLCMVRYSNINFVNQSDDTIAFKMYNTRDVPDQTLFDSKVDKLLQNLSYSAGLSEKRYGVGRTSMMGNMTIYGYVDCTRDVSGEDCTSCLFVAVKAVPNCCLGKWAGWIATPTCNIQFNMDPVDHDDWMSNPPYIDTDEYSPSVPTGSPTRWTSGTRGRGSSSNTIKIFVIVGVAIVVILVCGAVMMTVIVAKKRKRETQVAERRVENGEVVWGDDHDIEVRSCKYDFDVLAAATDNFSAENRLGDRRFGTVYWGKMAAGEEIAVKKLATGSRQGIREFWNEVRLLLKLQHKNLVQLLGCCVHGDDFLLVCEYFPNTSLDRILFDKSKSPLLDWAKRWNIIIGVARGLVYLHEDSRHKTIHRDIKASNILLDQHLNPKISDFGIAKLFDDGQSGLRTNRIVGTFRYMAPEYVRGMVSTKGDVFSFGVLMLEIISGRRNHEKLFNDNEQELLNLTARLDREGRQLELVDGTIGVYPSQDILRCIKIGLLCCQERVQNRPTMSLALTVLTTRSITLPSVGRVAYQGRRENSAIIENPSQEFSGAPTEAEIGSSIFFRSRLSA